jgi:hypothetical protein
VGISVVSLLYEFSIAGYCVKSTCDPNKHLEGGSFISSQVWRLLLNIRKLKLNALR